MTPNLDAQTPEDLMQFWLRHQNGRGFALLGLTGKSAKRIAGELAAYASNKATAMQCRVRGDITTARMYEDICERIYSRLPNAARW